MYKSDFISFIRKWTFGVLQSILFIGLVGTAVTVPAAEGKKEDDEGLQCEHLHLIAQGYLAQHVTYSQFDSNLERRTIDQFIKRLDSSKIYLLKPDIDLITQWLTKYFRSNKRSDCQALVEIQKLYLKRVTDRAEFAKKVLDKNFKFDKNVSLVLNSKKRDYFASQSELENYQRKYIHFQVSSYLNTDMELKEAKEHVIRAYERTVRRISEWKQEDLYSSYLDSFARSLDPHSTFFSYDALEDFQISMSLSLEGIGATLSQQDGFTVVEQLVPGGAADRQGSLETKDKIIAVGQGEHGKFENVIEMDLRDVVRKIRGRKGTKVRLRVLRKKEKAQEKLDIVLVRDEIKLEDEAAAISYIDRKIGERSFKIGILNLPSFYSDSKSGGRTSASDMKKLLAEAKKNKVDGIVLDLSKNGGGSLDDAVAISGLFFKTGAVVKQSGKNPKKSEKVLADTDESVDYNGPLVVLTSRVTASASEIVSGTLQDYRRAVIVGADHTFGKGSIQSVIPLPQKLGAFKVTIGYFFVPGGNSTQHRGVSSDVIFPSALDSDEIGEKSLDYSLPPKKLKPFLSEEAYVSNGDGMWRKIDEHQVAILKEKSRLRVSQNEEFKKIQESLVKAEKKKDEIVKVGELLKEREEEEKKEKEEGKVKSKEERLALYLKRPEIQESMNVISDLIEIQSKDDSLLVRTHGEKKGLSSDQNDTANHD